MRQRMAPKSFGNFHVARHTYSPRCLETTNVLHEPQSNILSTDRLSKKKGAALKATNLRNHLDQQLGTWTVFGPFKLKSKDPLWLFLPLDGASTLPSKCSYQGALIKPVRMQRVEDLLDFRKVYGQIEDRPHAVAFCELDVGADVTLHLTYDADWSAAWWLDGAEVAETRSGNCGPVGSMRHPLLLGLKPGRHVLSVRVGSGIMGWNVTLRLVKIERGLSGLVRTDRGAPWRNYSKSLIRHENRPTPDGTCAEMSKEQFEELAANVGIDARWIAVVDAHRGSHYASPHLPSSHGQKPEYEGQLKEWVQVLHRNRISAMSWYPLSLCRPGAEQRTDWRQQYLVQPRRDDQGACCIHSSYGEAVIRYTTEALLKFDLDGFWFDGSAFTPAWTGLSCMCPSCQAKFKANTGLDFPTRLDWSQPTFRRWVAWRYEAFADYWQRLVDAIHAVAPQATVVFNHYHRENIGWNGGVPLNPFGRDFISGTEADSEPLKGAFHTRCMRAYGRPHTEVWMEMKGRHATPGGPRFNPRELMDFALSCTTAGGHASFGGGGGTVELPACQELTRELQPRAPYLGLPSVPHIALHLSQQTETFVFGRNPALLADDGWTDYYWNSLTGWHHALALAGHPCDIIYDAHLTPATLRRFPIVVMPLATALTAKQHRALLSYVQGGGTLVAGPWYGLCDEEGETRNEPLGSEQLFPFGRVFPSWDEIAQRPEYTFAIPNHKQPVTCRPLMAVRSGNRVRLDWRRNTRICRISRVGQGRIIQMAVDLGTLFRYSKAEPIVRALAGLLADLPRPSAEIVDGPPLHMGIFRRGRRQVAIHLQQFAGPWEGVTARMPKPPTRWNTILRWNGARPRAMRCAVPEIGPDLPIERYRGGWQITLPPMVWGQVVLVDL